MHEIGIAQSIIDSTLEEAERVGADKVSYIEVEVGELTQVEPRVLQEALGLLLRGPMLVDARVEVKLAKASFACGRCSREWAMDETRRQLEAVSPELRVVEPDSVEVPLHFLPYLYPAFVRCPACGSADTSVKEGEDVYVRRVVFDG